MNETIAKIILGVLLVAFILGPISYISYTQNNTCKEQGYDYSNGNTDKERGVKYIECCIERIGPDECGKWVRLKSLLLPD